MKLTPKQIAERRKGLGGSDAGTIVSGDWGRLYLEKTGQAEPEDLSGVWPVQLGIVTEELNLDWYERKTGRKALMRGDVAVSKKYPFLRLTIDGFDPLDKAIIQAKHVNGFSKIEDVVARYTPQVTHEMIVMECQRAYLSVIVGASEPTLEMIELDEFFAAEYVAKAKEFWGYVERGEMPPGGAGAVAPPPPPEKMREVDMSGNNAWAAGAADWLQNAGPAKLFKGAEKVLKDLVEPDVGVAKGHGIIIKRAKNNALTIKEQ